MRDFLAVEGLVSGYGDAVVLEGLSFSLGEGRSLAVIGRNGVGKTTLLDTIAGVTTWRSGSICLGGVELSHLRPEARARAGIGWVPQERNIFASLTVEENLLATARRGRWTLADIYSIFPRLEERKSNLGFQLSGGEQQMLAIARALLLNPKLLLLDEPMEGLAPIIVEKILATITRLVRDEGLTTIIVEQHAHMVLEATDQALILDRGQIVHASNSAELLADDDTLNRHLGVGLHG